MGPVTKQSVAFKQIRAQGLPLARSFPRLTLFVSYLLSRGRGKGSFYFK